MIATTQVSEFDIFLRLWDQPKLSRVVAEQILKLQFGDDDRTRIVELTAKNRAADITPSESEELDKYVRVGGILSVLHSRARKTLHKVREKS